MDSFMPALEHGLLLLACVLAIPVLLINGYMSIRKRFPITVNCWFCNKNTRVPYENANGFMCPGCQQYNGFNEDGSYNKYIPEQYDEKRNNQTPTCSVRQSLDKSDTNGFCKNCNINQDLKVKQLASFVPINEKKFDAEVEDYRKKLEEVYRLCPKCENILRVTLSVQNSWFFGQTVNYLRKMRKSGTTLLNLNAASHGLTKNRKRSIVTSTMQLLLILLAFFILYNNLFMKLLLSNAHEIYSDAVQYIPHVLIHQYNEVETHLKTAINMTEAYIHNNFDTNHFFGTEAFTKHKSVHLSIVGLLVQSVLLLWADDSSTRKKDFLSWVGLMLLSLLPYNKNFHPYVHVVESQLASYVVLSVLFRKYIPQKQNIKLVKRKLPASTPLSQEQDGEYSDKEDDILEEVSNQSKNSTNTSLASIKTIRSDKWTKSERSKIISDVLRKLYGKTKTSPKVKTQKPSTSLNKSLNDLHLSNADLNKLKQSTKPLISPPKFTANSQVITNPLWGNFVDISRSSSSTSGFASQVAENENVKQNSLPHTRKSSVSEGSECSELRNVFTPQSNPTVMKNSPPSNNYTSQNLKSGNNACEFMSNKPQNTVGNNLNGFSQNNKFYSKNLLSPSSVFSPTSPSSPGHYNMANYPQMTPVYNNENTFYPNLNQNSMLYIQVNKSPSFQSQLNSTNRVPAYSSRLFNMEALSKLGNQKNCDLAKTNHLNRIRS